MNGATPEAWAKIRIMPKITRIATNGIRNHSFAFHKKTIKSLASPLFEKKLFRNLIFFKLSKLIRFVNASR